MMVMCACVCGFNMFEVRVMLCDFYVAGILTISTLCVECAIFTSLRELYKELQRELSESI